MSRIIDPRALSLTVGPEDIVMPGAGQWSDTWMTEHAWALSPMLLTRSRQGSLGDPGESGCSLTIIAPVTALTSTSPATGRRPWYGSEYSPLVGDVVEVTGDDARHVFAGHVSAVRVSDTTVRLTDGTTLDALRIEVDAAGVLRILARTRIGYTPDDLPDAVGNTVGFRLGQITEAVEEVSGLHVLWDRLAPELPTSWVADRDVDSQPALDVIMDTVTLADRVIVERGLDYSIVSRDQVTQAPWDLVLRTPSGARAVAWREPAASDPAAAVARATAALVTDDGDPATEVTRTEGGGAAYALPMNNVMTVPPDGWWAAVSTWVKAIEATTAATMRLLVRLQNGSTNVAQTIVQAPVPVGVWTRITAAVQRPAGLTPNNFDAIWYPSTSTSPLGPLFRGRRTRLAFAPTRAEAVALAEAEDPYRAPTDLVVAVPARSVPTPAWVLDAEGLATQFAFGFTDETQIPGSRTPVDTNQPVGDPVAVFDDNGNMIGSQRPEWLERTERTTRVDHPTAGQDYGVSTWAVRGDGLRTIRQFGASTPAGGPGNAELRGALVARFGAPRWRPDGGISLLLDETPPGELDPLLYGYEPPFGYPLLTITDAPPGREHWRVVGSVLAIGHAADEAVSLTLEHPSLGLPTGVRWYEVDPQVTIADTAAPGWTWLDCLDARTIQSGTPLEPPATPTNLVPSRISDTTTRLTWDTAGGPATAVTVEEKVNGATAWSRSALITTRPGSAEVVTAADRATVYRVTLSNPAGTSDPSAPSATIRTRPNVIGLPSWRWAGTSIVGTWLLDTAIPPDQYTIQIYRGIRTITGTTTWDAGPTLPVDQATANLPGGTTSWTWPNAPRPPAGGYIWAVMARVTTVDGTTESLRSGYYPTLTADEY